jgi:hypothetical protein
MSVSMRTHLRAGDLPIVAEAAVCSLVVHMGLRCISVRRLLTLLTRIPRIGPCPPIERVARIARIAESVSRRLSADPTCLKSSLVLYALLRRRRFDAQLVVGARRDGAQPFEAHAWIEHDGRVLCGAGRREAFGELWRVPADHVRGTTP